MRVYRRGPLYIVVHSLDRAFVFDARDGSATGDLDPVRYLGSEAIKWLPVLDSQPLPAALDALLILRFPGR